MGNGGAGERGSGRAREREKKGILHGLPLSRSLALPLSYSPTLLLSYSPTLPLSHSPAPYFLFPFMLGIHCPCEISPGVGCAGDGGAGAFSEDEAALISEAVWPSRSAR